MNVYVATAEFHLPVEGVLVSIGDTVSKYSGSVKTLVNALSYDNCALHQWVGSDDSLNYLSFIGSVPDPLTPGSALGGTKTIPMGAEEVAVSYSFGSVPSSVVAIVWKSDSSNIFATVRLSSVTASGFTVDLSGPTPAAGYVLSWVATV